MTIVHFENIRRLSLVFFGLLSKLKTRSSHVSICAFHCGPAGREVQTKDLVAVQFHLQWLHQFLDSEGQ